MTNKKNLVKKFDDAVIAIEKKVSVLKGKEYLKEYVNNIKNQRGELIKAIENNDIDQANQIIDQTVAFGREVDKMKKRGGGIIRFKEKPKKWFSDFGQLFKKPKGKITKASGKEKQELIKKGKEREREYLGEMERLEADLAKKEVEIEGLKGAYAKLSGEMGELKRSMRAKQAKDNKELSGQVQELKKGLDVLHGTMQKEFAARKTSYKDFGFELLHLAITVAEIEDRIEKDDVVNEIDVLQLNQAIDTLEKKLVLIEVNEKHRRLELIDRVEKDQRKILKKLEGKASSKQTVSAIKQYVTEIKHELDERDARVAADMQVELKSSYYTLTKKLKKIEGALDKARNKKDLAIIHKKVSGLTKDIQHIRDEELEMQRELEQQHLSDKALLQKITGMGRRLNKSDEMDQIVIGDIHKTIEALEMEVKTRRGNEKLIDSLDTVKNKLAKIEKEVLVCDVCGKKCKNARGLFLHKKMAHRTKKKTVKKKSVKKKKLFGLLR